MMAGGRFVDDLDGRAECAHLLLENLGVVAVGDTFVGIAHNMKDGEVSL